MFAHFIKAKESSKEIFDSFIKYYETLKNACGLSIRKVPSILNFSPLKSESRFYAKKKLPRKRAQKKNEKKWSLSKLYR